MEACRRHTGRRDSEILDLALAALIEREESERERRALEAHPYESDAALAWTAPSGPDLDYAGEVPAEVLELAAERRRASPQ